MEVINVKVRPESREPINETMAVDGGHMILAITGAMGWKVVAAA